MAYASKLSVSNFVLKGFKVRSSGKEVETDKASRIDRLKINFDITENKIAESGNKELYIVAKNTDGTLLKFADKPTGNFISNGNRITYSDKIFVNYIKGRAQAPEITWDSEDFKKGDYVLEIYERTAAGTELIGKATKTLD